MLKNNLIEINKFNPETSKLKSLKIADGLGFNIPKTLVIENVSFLEKNCIDKLVSHGWFLRECSTNEMFGYEIPMLTNEHKKEMFFQELIYSEFYGNAWSYKGEIYIEIIIGNGYGLNRMGITPTTYSSLNKKLEVVVQNDEYRVHGGKTELKSCGKYSEPPSMIIREILKMAKSFPNEIIEWTYADEKLFFLESYAFPAITKCAVEGYVNKNNNIVLLPKAELTLWPLCRDKKAVIVREGGYSSHLAILCGLFNKPFVRYRNPIDKNQRVKIEYAKVIFL